MTESVWIEPFPDEILAADDRFTAPEARFDELESVELAFVAALQHLPARQRAALILKDVLGYSAAEIADHLETSTASINSALQRARGTLEDKLPDRSQQENARTLGDEEIRRVVEEYMEAWERGDVEAVAAMLAEDAILTMPPMATWYDGRENVKVFLSDFAFAKQWDGTAFVPGQRTVRLVRTSANGQPALGAYRLDPEAGVYRPYTIQVLRLRGREIVEVTGFVVPGYFRHFDLPAELPV